MDTDTDTFTMADVAEIELEQPPKEAAEPAPEGEVKKDAEPKTTSFADAFKRATGEVKPEAATEAEAEAAPEVEESKSSRSASDFKKLKSDRDSARKELDVLKSRLSELEDKDVNGVLEDVQQERDELSKRLRVTNIERHPEFERKYSAKINAAVEQAKGVVGEENAERIEKLLNMGESEYRTNALEDLFSELSQSKSAVMGAIIQRVGEINAERAGALADSENTYAEIVRQQDETHKAHIASSDAVFSEIQKEASNIELYQPREGDNEWNLEIDARVAQAKKIFSGDNDQHSLARASFWAASGPKYRELLADSIEINRRLREQLEGINSATPSMSSSQGDAAPVKEKGFMEHFNELTGR